MPRTSIPSPISILGAVIYLAPHISSCLRFPTEASLDDLDTFAISIESKISAVEDSLSKAVQNQSRIGHQASKDLASAQASIQELFSKLNEIKSQASHSERMVQEICADIRKVSSTSFISSL